MAGLGEEEPALGEQSCRLHRQRHQPVPAPSIAMHTSTSGAANASSWKPTRVRRTACSDARWKNSRVLNEPLMKPCDFWTIRGCLIPMAVCNVDFGRSRALRTSDAARPANPSTVRTSAPTAKNRTSAGAADVAYAAARANPDAHPSRMKLTTVSGVAHSRRNGRHA